MARFRKLPVIVEATQWFKNGDHPLDYVKSIRSLNTGLTITAEQQRLHNYEGQLVRYWRRPDWVGAYECEQCGQRMHDHGWIDTLEGGHRVCPGDWIITGVKGEFYPCKPDIFAKTYEKVTEVQEVEEK